MWVRGEYPHPNPLPRRERGKKEVSGFEALFEEGAEDVGEEEDDDAKDDYGGGVGDGGEPASGRWRGGAFGASVGEESYEVEHCEGEEDFCGQDCYVGDADEAGGDAVEGEDGAGHEEYAEGGVDEGEVVAPGVEGVVGWGAAEAWTEDEEVVDAAADPGHGGDVVDPAHDEEEDVVNAHGGGYFGLVSLVS